MMMEEDGIMNGIDIYTNVCIEIDMLENVLEDIRQEISILQRKMYQVPGEIRAIEYSGMPKGSADHTSFDRQYNRLMKLIEEEDTYATTLENKRKLKKELINKYREITGLKEKVRYKRDIEKKTLTSIAEELGYSESHIKRISSQMPRKK